MVGTAPAAQTSDSYTSNYASVGWQYRRNRTTIAVSGRWEKDLYGSQPSLDNTRGGAEFNVQRQLTRAFTAQILGRYYKTDYAGALVKPLNGSSDYSDGLIAAALTWRHGRGLEVRLRAEHTSRDGNGSRCRISGESSAVDSGIPPASSAKPDNDPGA